MLTEIAPKRRRKKAVSEASNLTNTPTSTLANAAAEAMKGHVYAAQKIISSMNISQGAKDKINKRLTKYGTSIKTNQDMSDFIYDIFVPWATNIIDTHVVKESSNKMEANMKSKTPSSFSTQLSALSAKIPQTSAAATAFSNALSSIANKLQFDKARNARLTDTETEILNWIKSLPKPINTQQMIADGIAQFGKKLHDDRMIAIHKFKARDDSSFLGKTQLGQRLSQPLCTKSLQICERCIKLQAVDTTSAQEVANE